MPSFKQTKRDVGDFWKLLKQERRARSKLANAADLAESGARLARLAGDLKKLSVRMAWHESRANQPVRPKKTVSKPTKAAEKKEQAPSPARRNSRKRTAKHSSSTKNAD